MNGIEACYTCRNASACSQSLFRLSNSCACNRSRRAPFNALLVRTRQLAVDCAAFAVTPTRAWVVSYYGTPDKTF
jgi:hypothetical protein